MRTLCTVAIGLAVAAVAHAGEDFTYQGPAGSAAWEVGSSWSGGSGAFSAWPGQSPEAGSLDSATVVAGSALDVSVVGPVVLDRLTLGAGPLTETVISGPGSITASTIEISGNLFGINRLEADLLLGSDLTLSSLAQQLTIDGRLVNGSPDGNLRTVENATDTPLVVNGPVLLSDTPGAPGDLRFTNSGVSTLIVDGVISDGDAPGGSVTYAKGDFDLRAAHTYTGETRLGSNHPNVGALHTLHTDTSLGLGRVVVTGGNELKIIRGAPGKGTRTLENDIRLAREVEFAGAESFVLNGDLWQSNGRSFINRLAVGSTLTINGDIYASDTSDVREWIFEGPGTTIVNGVIDDSLNVPNLVGGSFRVRDGLVVLTNPSAAAYSGPTTIEATLQLGAGGDAVGLNGGTVSGGGALVLDHSGELTFDTQIGGGLQVHHNGAGVTRLTRANTNSGGYVAGGGTLLVDGAAGDVLAEGGTIGGDGTVGVLDVFAGSTVAPGDGVGQLAASSLQLRAASSLSIEVDGADADRLAVTGAASLGGDLSIELLGGGADPLSDYVVLTAGSLTGQFGNAADGARVATADREGSFLATYGATSLTLSSFALAGDYNDDGLVDAADYTVWRDSVGQPATGLPNDIDGGTVGAAQYDTWRANIGASLAGGALSVPEPGGVLLAGTLLCLLPGRKTLAR